ncbi:hypothetical protein [Kitasatospora sp. NRRL B-11411]|uniref:hypothetical protein n=1 Tax=Kitasatospora sp. NRRL B-11411 TaxID=1463822 RepID=UPI0004C38027|nr:hypothetical protein [Kitasatospora sp. NRRL B-11411]
MALDHHHAHPTESRTWRPCAAWIALTALAPWLPSATALIGLPRIPLLPALLLALAPALPLGLRLGTTRARLPLLTALLAGPLALALALHHAVFTHWPRTDTTWEPLYLGSAATTAALLLLTGTAVGTLVRTRTTTPDTPR